MTSLRLLEYQKVETIRKLHESIQWYLSTGIQKLVKYSKDHDIKLENTSKLEEIISNIPEKIPIPNIKEKNIQKYILLEQNKLENIQTENQTIKQTLLELIPQVFQSKNNDGFIKEINKTCDSFLYVIKEIEENHPHPILEELLQSKNSDDLIQFLMEDPQFPFERKFRISSLKQIIKNK